MNHSGSPGIRAVDVWDVLRTAITTPASIGVLLDGFFTRYSYAGALANGATYIPADGTIAYTVFGDQNLTAVSKMRWIDTGNHCFHDAYWYGVSCYGMSVTVMCDGFVGVRNDIGVSTALQIEGLTMG